MTLKAYDITDFSAGLVTNYPYHLAPVGSASSISNVDLSRQPGTLTKRKGTTAFVANSPATAQPVKSLHEFITSTTAYTIAISNGTVYNVNALNWATSIGTISNPSGWAASVNFNDLLILCDPGGTTQKWTGSGSLAALLGTPPSSVNHVAVHNNRVWMANTAAGKSRLHYCAQDNPEDWTTEPGASFIDIEKDSGDQITGLASVREGLLVFKNQSIHVVNGFQPPFQVKKLSGTIGCSYGRSIAVTEGFAIFAFTDRDGTGIYSASPEGISSLSYSIKPTIDTAYSNPGAYHGLGVRYKNQYWITAGSNEVLVLDYVNGNWSKYTNMPVGSFVGLRGGNMLAGHNVNRWIFRFEFQEGKDTDENGADTSITMSWRSNNLPIEGFAQKKQLKELSLHMKDNAASYSAKIYGTDSNGLAADSSTFTFSASSTSSNGDAVVTSNLDQGVNVNTCQLEILESSGLNGQATVYGASVLADVLPRK